MRVFCLFEDGTWCEIPSNLCAGRSKAELLRDYANGWGEPAPLKPITIVVEADSIARLD